MLENRQFSNQTQSLKPYSEGAAFPHSHDQLWVSPFMPVVLQNHGITAIRTQAMSAKAQS